MARVNWGLLLTYCEILNEATDTCFFITLNPWWLRQQKRLPTMQETWVRSLDWEDSLEKEMATHSSIHAWKIPWTEEPGGLQSMGS